MVNWRRAVYRENEDLASTVIEAFYDEGSCWEEKKGLGAKGEGRGNLKAGMLAVITRPI